MVAIAAQGDLIKLGTFLVHTQNTNMTHVVMTTGIHTTGNVQIQFTQVVNGIEIIKTA